MFGIDTLTITCAIQKQDEWSRVRRSLMRKGGEKWQYQYKKQGVHRVSFPCHEESFYYAMQLQLSPAELLGRLPHSITSIDDVREQLPAALEAWLAQRTTVKKWLNTLDWSLERIDFACDVQHLSWQELNSFIALARAGQAPQHFGVLHLLDWKGTAVYGNQNERVQFYDKGKQMRKKHADEDPAVIAAYQGTLRVEVQISKQRLDRIKKMAGEKRRTLGQFLKPGLAEAIVRQRVDEVIGGGPYKTAGGAKQVLAAKLTNGSITKAKRDKWFEFINYVELQGSLHQVRAYCKRGMGIVSAATFDVYVKELSELGVMLPLIPSKAPLRKLPALLPAARPETAVSLREWVERLQCDRAARSFSLHPGSAPVSIDRVRFTPHPLPVQVKPSKDSSEGITIEELLAAINETTTEDDPQQRDIDSHSERIIINIPQRWMRSTVVEVPQTSNHKEKRTRNGYVAICRRPGKSSGWILRGPPDLLIHASGKKYKE